MSRPRPYIRDRTTALVAGYVLIFAGIFCLRDAYERRNINRPFINTFLPG